MAKRNTQKKRNLKYQVSNRQLRANLKYKDTIFRMLYKEKKNLLSLYNDAGVKRSKSRSCLHDKAFELGTH